MSSTGSKEGLQIDVLVMLLKDTLYHVSYLYSLRAFHENHQKHVVKPRFLQSSLISHHVENHQKSAAISSEIVNNCVEKHKLNNILSKIGTGAAKLASRSSKMS